MMSNEQGTGATAGNIFLVDLRLKNSELVLPRQNILSVELRESILQIVPTLKIVMNDKGNFTENFPIVDGDVIQLLIAPTAEAEPIEMEFIVSEFAISPKIQATTSVLTISAYMNIPTLFTPDIIDAKRGNSLSVLSSVARESGVSVVNDSSIEPSDNMVWYRNGCVFSYIGYIIANSFIPNDTLFFYADHSGKYHYNTYKTAANSESKFRAKFSLDDCQKIEFTDDDEGIMYYKNFDVVSINGTVKNECGYGVMCFAYDGTGSSHDVVNDSFKTTDLENVYTGLASPSSLKILPWAGGNPNTHDNFTKAKVQNLVYKMNMFENSLNLMINPLTDVSLMDGIDLEIPSFFDSGDSSNSVWSGKYVVATIVHSLSFGGVYDKVILVVRRGMNKSKYRNYENVK